MPKPETNPNDEKASSRNSDFGVNSSFVIRASSFIWLRLKSRRHQILGAARDDQFLSGRTERRKGERFSIDSQDRFAVINRDLGRHRGGRVPQSWDGAQVRHQVRAFEYDEAVVERVALVSFGKAGRNYARNAFELERRRR